MNDPAVTPKAALMKMGYDSEEADAILEETKLLLAQDFIEEAHEVSELPYDMLEVLMNSL